MPSVPSLPRLFFAFLRLGATAFGGPAMVANVRDLAVSKMSWLDETSFKNGVALCQAIPGATAMQTAAYVGLRTRGVRGGLAAYVGFGLPAFCLMVVLSAAYERMQSLPITSSLLAGVRVVVVAIMVNATVSFTRMYVKGWRDGLVVVAAGLALVLQVNPFVVIVVAAALGCVLLAANAQGQNRLGASPAPGQDLSGLFVVLACGAVVMAWLALTDRLLFDLASSMMRIDVFAFGGGFVSLPLMEHAFVDVLHWIERRVFMDGIALGQVTPGPIVITSTFIGYLVRGGVGAVVATASIFFPSFAILTLVLPHFDRLQASGLFRRATRGALLSFVGLLLSVTVRFGMAVSWSGPAIALAGAALVALLVKVDIVWVVLAGALLSLLA